MQLRKTILFVFYTHYYNVLTLCCICMYFVICLWAGGLLYNKLWNWNWFTKQHNFTREKIFKT